MRAKNLITLDLQHAHNYTTNNCSLLDTLHAIKLQVKQCISNRHRLVVAFLHLTKRGNNNIACC